MLIRALIVGFARAIVVLSVWHMIAIPVVKCHLHGTQRSAANATKSIACVTTAAICHGSHSRHMAPTRTNFNENRRESAFVQRR